MANRRQGVNMNLIHKQQLPVLKMFFFEIHKMPIESTQLLGFRCRK